MKTYLNVALVILLAALISWGCGSDDNDDNGTDPVSSDYNVIGTIDRAQGQTTASAHLILLKSNGDTENPFLTADDATVTVNGVQLTTEEVTSPVYHIAFVGDNIPAQGGSSVEVTVVSVEYGNFEKTLTMPGGTFRVTSPEQGTTVSPGTFMTITWSSATNASSYYANLTNYSTGMSHFENVVDNLFEATGPVLYDDDQTGQVAAAARVRAFNGSYFSISPPSFDLGLECSVTDEVLIYVNQGGN